MQPSLCAQTRSFEDTRFAKLKRAAGVRDAEIERLAAAILEGLAGRTLGADELRAALPARLVRSLGEAGKKLGDATTLPM